MNSIRSIFAASVILSICSIPAFADGEAPGPEACPLEKELKVTATKLLTRHVKTSLRQSYTNRDQPRYGTMGRTQQTEFIFTTKYSKRGLRLTFHADANTDNYTKCSKKILTITFGNSQLPLIMDLWKIANADTNDKIEFVCTGGRVIKGAEGNRDPETKDEIITGGCNLSDPSAS